MKNRGFTIVESLVAIAILLVVISGVGSAIQTGISSYIFSKNQIIAFYLAQEGFEQIRNIRDENSLNGRNWLTGLSLNLADPCYFGNACTVEPIVSSSATRCVGGPGTCPFLGQDTATGFYGYNSSWPATVFKREIILQELNDHEIAILVNVDWSKGVVTRRFQARENILDWQ